MKTRRPRLLFLVTEDWYFCSHRLSLACAAREAGFDVSVATRVSEHGEEIRSAGLTLHPLKMRRDGRNPLGEVQALWEIFSLYRRVRPDIAHHVAIKPVVYGSLVAGLARVPYVVNAIAGLGFVFGSASTKAKLLRPLMTTAFRTLLGRKNTLTVVQNPDDRQQLLALVRPDQIEIIRGSGLDTERFRPSPEPAEPIVATLVSRMLWDKGIGEFVEAARLLHEQGVPVTMRLIGRPDPSNPGSVTKEKLQRWHDEGIVEWQGHRTDIDQVWRESHIAVLPSYYREGLPRSLLEAAASGRPMVSTDAPGCREIVVDGVTGLSVPPRDADAVAKAIRRLVEQLELRQQLGHNARRLVEEEMSDAVINARFMALYRSLLDRSTGNAAETVEANG